MYNCEFEAGLGYVERVCVKNRQTGKQKQTSSCLLLSGQSGDPHAVNRRAMIGEVGTVHVHPQH